MKKITQTVVSFWCEVLYIRHRTTFKDNKCEDKYKFENNRIETNKSINQMN